MTMSFYPERGNPAIAEKGILCYKCLGREEKTLITPPELREQISGDINLFCPEMDGSGTTHGYLKLVAAYCKVQSIKSIVLIAHPDHYWRSILTAQKLGLGVIRVNCDSIPYDDDRPRWRFIIREIGARIVYYATGKI